MCIITGLWGIDRKLTNCILSFNDREWNECKK